MCSMTNNYFILKKKYSYIIVFVTKAQKAENLYPSETKPFSHRFALLTFIHSNIQVCKFLQFYSLFETLLYDESFRNGRLIFL